MKKNFSIGDAVRVFDLNGRRTQPEGGWGGVIVRVGRELVYIEYGNRRNAVQFRMDTRRIHNDYGNQWFETVDEAALHDRRRKAISELRKHRLSLDEGCDLALDKLERIAAILTRDEEEEA